MRCLSLKFQAEKRTEGVLLPKRNKNGGIQRRPKTVRFLRRQKRIRSRGNRNGSPPEGMGRVTLGSHFMNMNNYFKFIYPLE